MTIKGWISDGQFVQNFLMLSVEFPNGRTSMLLKGHFFVQDVPDTPPPQLPRQMTFNKDIQGILRFFTVTTAVISAF